MSTSDPDRGVPEDVAARLATEPGVWLATNRTSGPPHVTPVWFVFGEGVWWISTGAGSVKARNIMKSPEVSLALEDGRYPVVAEGSAQIHYEDFPAWVVDAFARKYDGWDMTTPEEPGDIRILLEIPTRRWLLRVSESGLSASHGPQTFGVSAIHGGVGDEIAATGRLGSVIGEHGEVLQS